MSFKIITFEEISKEFIKYVNLFYKVHDPKIPRPIKAKKNMYIDEIQACEGWNKHTCKICSSIVVGGAGFGWTNLTYHLSFFHPLGSSNSWRAFYIENKANPTQRTLQTLVTISEETKCLFFYVNLIVKKFLPIFCCE
jgi:hypothetical protein